MFTSERHSIQHLVCLKSSCFMFLRDCFCEQPKNSSSFLHLLSYEFRLAAERIKAFFFLFITVDIQGVWNLRQTTMDVHDKYLVLSFVGETRLLAINEVCAHVCTHVAAC